MVKGLNLFREYFKEYQDQYVLIGGAACEISFEDNNASFRATCDLDMVLIVEALTREFGERFWQFIKDGGYQNRIKSSGKAQFYRFDKPSSVGYPQMIELFSRGNTIPEEGVHLTPVHIDDNISSLSAILLNEEYYDTLLKGRDVINGISVLRPTYLILFKAKAWMDLKEKKEQGEHIDERDIKKHKNDILRLVSEMVLERNCELSKSIRCDMKKFTRLLQDEPIDLKNLKIGNISKADIIETLKDTYNC